MPCGLRVVFQQPASASPQSWVIDAKREQTASRVGVIAVTVMSANCADPFTSEVIGAVSMTKDRFDALGIASQCREPEPLACYERQNLREQSEGDGCLCCPVASWITAMVLSDKESLALGNLPISDQCLEPNAMGRIGEGIASIQGATLGLKAA